MVGVRLRQLAVAVLGAVLCAVMVLLGLWQMQVFESQKSDSTAARAAGAPVDLESNLYQGRVGDLYGRRVTAPGQYVPGADQLVGTDYPLRVVSAFRTTGGRTLAVVRGTVARGQQVPAVPAGRMTVGGIILPSESEGAATMASAVPPGTRPSLQLQELVQQWDPPMLDGYVTLPASDSTARGLGVAVAKVPDTQGGRARNQGYALQWWAFAAFGAAATVVGVRQIGRSARFEAEHEDA